MKYPSSVRDTLVIIKQRVAVQDPTFGSYSYTWSDLATEWAMVEQLGVSRGEYVSDNVQQAVRKFRIGMPYRDDVTSAMRIVLPDGSPLKITSPPKVEGRREGLTIMCEDHTTQGEEP